MDDSKIEKIATEIQDRIDELARQVVDEGISALRLTEKIVETIADLRDKYGAFGIDVADAVHIAVLKIRHRRADAAIDAAQTRAAIAKTAHELRRPFGLATVDNCTAVDNCTTASRAAGSFVPPFSPGDVVSMRHGGPLFTVCSVQCHGDVEIMDGDSYSGQLAVHYVPAAMLKHAHPLDEELPV